MKSSTAYILGAVAGAAVGALFLYKKRDMIMEKVRASHIPETIEDWARSAKRLGIKVKNTLLQDVTGPDGEAVYQDMYYRQFYENKMGSRVYLDEA